MVSEALTVVETARLRYDGERRNPWNEAECGHHYARAMASWAALVALSGFRYSAVERELTVAPRTRRQNFRCFWSVPSGWGSFSQSNGGQNQRVRIEVVEGAMPLARLALSSAGKAALRKASARLGSETIKVSVREEAARRVLTFEGEVKIAPGQALEVSLTT
jgi:hypothetical protein